MKTQRSLLIAVLTLTVLLLSLAIVSHARSAEEIVLDSHAMAGTRALAAPTETVKLTIIVVDQKGKPVADAEVDITHDAFGPEFRANDYHLKTNGEGVVTTDITIGNKWGEGSLYWPAVDIEATKDLAKGQGRVKFTGNWYRNPETGEWGLEKGRAGIKFVGPDYRPETCTIVMHPIDSRGFDVLTVEIKVVRDNGDAMDGATVFISGSAPNERAEAMTGPDGVATLSVPIMGSQAYGIQVSKTGFESKRATITLRKEQLGTIVSGPTIPMAKAAGVKVVVTVTDEDTHKAVVDAKVSLLGPQAYFETTDGSGKATLYVKEIGVYDVTISQANYETSSDKQIRTRLGEDAAKAFELKAKDKREEDTIEITVLQKNPTDKSAKPSPLPGALVSIGGRGTTTDSDGKATLKGTYALTEVATVTANGYKTPDPQPISVRKEVLTAKSYGRATFILEPDVAVSLIVEVRDDAWPHELLKNANAYLWLDNKPIAGEKAPAGEAAFTFKDSEDLPLAKLRDGLKLIAKAPDYELRESRITDLKPSLETYRATIFLKKVSAAAKESDRIRKAVETLETKVNTWKSSRPGTAQLQQFIDTAASETQDAHALMIELEAAAKALPELTTFGSDSLCAKVAKLQLGIRSNQAKVNANASQIDKSLKDAVARAPRCASPAEAESLRAVYRQAIKELGEMGKLKSDAARSVEELSLLIHKASAAQRTLAQMKDKAALIQTLALASKQNESKAIAYVGRIGPAVRNSSIIQYSLQDELDRLLATVDPTTGLPADLAPRVKAMSDSLAVPNNVPTQASIIDNAPVEIAQLEARANARVAEFDNKVCPVVLLEDAFDDMKQKIDDAGLDIGLANDLPTQADVCIAKATNRNTGPTTQPNAGDKGDNNVSVANDPRTEKPVFEPPAKDKADTSKAPTDQNTNSGGFWDAAKTAKKNVDDKITNKSNTPTNASSPNENSPGNNRGTKTATNKAGNNPPPTVEKLPEDKTTEVAANKTTNKTNNPPITVEAIPETYINNPPLSNRPAPKSGNKPPVVEEIPETSTGATLASNRPTTKTTSKPPVVEDIPETATTNVASNKPRSNSPVVEEIPETVASTNVASNRPRANSPQVEEIPETSSNSGPATSSSGGNQPNSSGASASSPAKAKPKKEKKPRDPNQPSIWTLLGGAVRTAITAQPNPGVGNNPAPNPNPGEGGGAQSLNLAGTWSVTTQSTGDDEMQQNWTRTTVWHVWNSGGGHWRISQVINGQTYDENYSTVDEGGGRFRLIGSNPDGSTYQMSGTYNQSQFQASTGGGQNRITISGTRQ
jgi:hypothetical protein